MDMIGHNDKQWNFYIFLTDNCRLFDLYQRPFPDFRKHHLTTHNIAKIQFAIFRAECHEIIRTCIIMPSGTWRFSLWQVVGHCFDFVQKYTDFPITAKPTQKKRSSVGTHRVRPPHRYRTHYLRTHAVCPYNPKTHLLADACDASLQGKIIQFSPSPSHRFSHAVCKSLGYSPFPRHGDSILPILFRQTFSDHYYSNYQTKPTSLTFVKDRREATLQKHKTFQDPLPMASTSFIIVRGKNIHSFH